MFHGVIMFLLIMFASLFYEVESKMESSISEVCENVQCTRNGSVCGMRQEGEGFRLRLFKDECQFKKYECAVQKNLVYELVPMYYCDQVFKPGTPFDQPTCVVYDCTLPEDNVPVCALKQSGDGYRIRLFQNKCSLWEYNCLNKEDFNFVDLYVCNGLKVSETGEMFNDNQLGGNDETTKPYEKFKSASYSREGNKNTDLNIDQDSEQTITKEKKDKDNSTIHDDELYIESDNEENEFENNHYIANDLSSKNKNNTDHDQINNKRTDEEDDDDDVITTTSNPDDDESIENVKDKDGGKYKNLVVVRGSLRDLHRVNETIARFFAATHVFDLPMKEISTDVTNEETRRMLVKIAGPMKVYKPWVVIPKNISDDFDHRPTLNSCYHKCPRKCPSTYAPVCGVPGRLAREPSQMFQNHCFMDVAQCKMFWENKSPTSLSSAYVESSFVFCLGDVMNQMYNFLPLVKTLQHMGRLPKKGRFRSRLSNLKFFNNMLAIKDPKLMG